MTVPQERLDQIRSLANQWEPLVGFQVSIPDWMISEMAAAMKYGTMDHAITNLADFGQYMTSHVDTTGSGSGALMVSQDVYEHMPWAFYGLSADQYQSQSSTYGTEYKKMTGQDITPDALAEAFKSSKDATGGLLTGGQYAQRLMNDVNLQKTYGWMKYGLDYTQWQQQKLQMQGQFGREIQNTEAATLLQYTHAASGSNVAARAQTPQPGQTKEKQVGVGQSEVR